jgi:hypothetical protein
MVGWAENGTVLLFVVEKRPAGDSNRSTVAPNCALDATRECDGIRVHGPQLRRWAALPLLLTGASPEILQRISDAAKAPLPTGAHHRDRPEGIRRSAAPPPEGRTGAPQRSISPIGDATIGPFPSAYCSDRGLGVDARKPPVLRLARLMQQGCRASEDRQSGERGEPRFVCARKPDPTAVATPFFSGRRAQVCSSASQKSK